MLMRVVAAAHQRPCLAMGEAQGERKLAVSRELVGVHPAIHGQVLGGRLEILSEGEDFDSSVPDIRERRFDLAAGLAKAEHDSGLDPSLIVSGVAPAGSLGEQS